MERGRIRTRVRGTMSARVVQRDALSGPLNRDRRYYLSDAPVSRHTPRGQLELRYPLPPPSLGCDRANFGGGVWRDALRHLHAKFKT